MNNKFSCKKVYVLKTVTSDVYKWSPGCPDYSKKKLHNGSGNIKPVFCTAIAGSQGQDWNTTYVYDIKLIDNQQAREAYVECDYVE